MEVKALQRSKRARTIRAFAALLQRLDAAQMLGTTQAAITEYADSIRQATFVTLQEGIEALQNWHTSRHRVPLTLSSIETMRSALLILMERVQWTAAEPVGATFQEHDDYAKFFKMLKMRVPRPAVEIKMRAAGLDPSVLDCPEEDAGEATPPTYADHPTYAKFFKMLSMGVPRPAVEIKMRNAALDPSVLDTPGAPAPGDASARTTSVDEQLLNRKRKPLHAVDGDEGASASTQIPYEQLDPDTPLGTAATFLASMTPERRLRVQADVELLHVCTKDEGGLGQTLERRLAEVSAFEAQGTAFEQVVQRLEAVFGEGDPWYQLCGQIRSRQPMALSTSVDSNALAMPHPFAEILALFESDTSYANKTIVRKKGATDPAQWLGGLTVSHLSRLCKGRKFNGITNYSMAAKDTPKALIDAMLAAGFPYGFESGLGNLPVVVPTTWQATLTFGSRVTTPRQALVQVLAPDFVSTLLPTVSIAALPDGARRQEMVLFKDAVDRVQNKILATLYGRLVARFDQTYCRMVSRWATTLPPIYASVGVEFPGATSWTTWSTGAEFHGHAAHCRDFCEHWTRVSKLPSQLDLSTFAAAPAATSTKAIDEEQRNTRRHAVRGDEDDEPEDDDGDWANDTPAPDVYY